MESHRDCPPTAIRGWIQVECDCKLTSLREKWTNYISNPNNYEKNGQRVDLVYGNAFVRTPDGKMVIDQTSGLYSRISDLGSSAKKIYGHADPDWQWGIVNNLSYKNFSIRFQFDV